MSRSRRKTPIRGMCGNRHHISEKEDKRRFNRKMRRINKIITATTVDPDAVIHRHKDEIEDVYGFAKDGKQYIDPKKFPEEMRK